MPRWTSSWSHSLCLLGLSAVLMFCSACSSPGSQERLAHPSSGLETLWVVDPERLKPSEQTLVLTLQGLVAEGSSAIWVKDVGMVALVLEDLVAEGVQTRDVGSVWELVSQFRDAIAGIVLYDLGTDSINVATSLCGPLQAIAIDSSLQAEAEGAGLEVLADVRGMDEVQAFAEYGSLFVTSAGTEDRPALLIEQAESKNAHLRDFAVAHRAFTVYGLDPEDHARIATALGHDLTAFGWGSDEYEWILQISSEGGAGIPADWSRNLSVLQRIPATLPERPHPTVRPVREGERIVAFVMSDGDNIQWMGGQFVSAEGFWASPQRGEFSMTWEMAPLLAEVYPRALAHFYQTASYGRAIDDFVAGPSGVGYAFHNYLPDREAFARRTVAAMKATDLTITTMLNANGGMEQSAELLAQPEIMGVIYKDYSPYNAKEGRIFWHEGKPCVSYRYLLWEPSYKNSPEGVAKAIAGLPASPQTDQNSYALINVHAWSFEEIGGPMEAVARTIELLPPKTRVVTAEELIVLLRENFGVPVQ